MARLREQTWVSSRWVPVSPLTDGSGSTSTIDSGPRLLAEDAVGSYPAPAADGRDWKYCGRALPLLSVKDWPISFDPTTLPPTVICEPSARLFSPGICATAVIASG